MGFTLIELLVVISIIVILMGLTASGIMMSIKKAKVQKTRTEAMNILTAVKRFRSEVGIYPSSIQKELLGVAIDKDMAFSGTASAEPDIFGPYLEFKSSNTDSSGNMLDAWGNVYKYYYPNCSNIGELTVGSERRQAVDNGFAIVLSFGPDGSNYTSDDIGSWQ